VCRLAFFFPFESADLELLYCGLVVKKKAAERFAKAASFVPQLPNASFSRFARTDFTSFARSAETSAPFVQKRYAPWETKRQDALDDAVSKVQTSIPA
jgi:hypothetical protein